MSPGARSATTLSVLGLLLVVGALWGWSATTQPLPAKVDRPVCEHRTVDKGSRVFPEDVTVSVFNAGSRTGLAGRVLQALHNAGFARGVSGNVEHADVPKVQVWAEDRNNPAVRLVASHLGTHIRVVRRHGPGAGVTVVVGDDFTHVVRGDRFAVAHENAEICSPPLD